MSLEDVKFNLIPVERKGSKLQVRLDSKKVTSEAYAEESKTERLESIKYVPPEGRRFIESPRFPFAKISEPSAGPSV